MEILYTVEPSLNVEEFVGVLRRSTLAIRRPVDDITRISKMLKNADLILTARDQAGVLIGVSRAITDFSYCTYLSDLAVDQKFQKHGIGRRLIHETHKEAGLATNLILLSAPQAETFYSHVGMEKHKSCWLFRGQE